MMRYFRNIALWMLMFALLSLTQPLLGQEMTEELPLLKLARW